jgi:hypothetical protein
MVHQSDLVLQVERADRLVQHHDPRRAQQHLREQRHLALAAAERMDLAVGQIHQPDGAQGFQRFQQRGVVHPHAQTVQLAQQHHVQHRKIEIHPRVLRHVAELSAPLGQALLV